jgi:hypothetical protein
VRARAPSFSPSRQGRPHCLGQPPPGSQPAPAGECVMTNSHLARCGIGKGRVGEPERILRNHGALEACRPATQRRRQEVGTPVARMCNHIGVGWLVMSILLAHAVTDDVGAAENKRSNAIKVLEATYGGNCQGVTKGNVTRFVASACDSKDLCNYRVYHKNLGGDPAEGCEKNFAVSYTCGKNTKPDACTLPAEAGKGGEDGHANNFCLLHCLSGADSPKGRSSTGPATSGVGTDGSNSVKTRQAKPPASSNEGGPNVRRSDEPKLRGFDEPW